MRSVMLEPLTALGFTEKILKDNHLRDREYKAFILEVNGFRLEYQMYSFMKRVLDGHELKVLPHYCDVIDLANENVFVFLENKRSNHPDGSWRLTFNFDFGRQFCKVYPAGNIPSEALYFRTRDEIDTYLQKLIQAIQQMVGQCNSLSQLHHYIHYDEQNLFKTQIMYQDYCTSFVYQLARRCEDDAGFSKLIDCMRRAFLNPYLVKYGKDSSNYVEAATAYDSRLEKLHDSYMK